MRFTIEHNRAYRFYTVSIPNYDGGEVVTAAEYDRLKASHDRLLEALKDVDENVAADSPEMWQRVREAIEQAEGLK